MTKITSDFCHNARHHKTSPRCAAFIMGVEDFWIKALGDFHLQHKKKLSEFAGKRVAVDLSVWIHAALHSSQSDASIALTSEPTYPTAEVPDIIMQKHGLLTANKIKPIYVFDGAPHVMNHARRLERESGKNKAKRECLALVDKAKRGLDITDDDRARALKARRNMACPTDALYAMIRDKFESEGIPFIVAPFEAEMQMVFLERKKIVDATMTEDSDAIVLGAQTVLTKVTFAKDAKDCQARVFNATEFFCGRGAGNSYRSQLTKWVQYLPEVASFLGNDYIKRLHGNGVVTVLGKPATVLVPAKEGLMDRLHRSPDRHKFLLDIEHLRQRPGWATQFEHTRLWPTMSET